MGIFWKYWKIHILKLMMVVGQPTFRAFECIIIFSFKVDYCWRVSRNQSVGGCTIVHFKRNIFKLNRHNISLVKIIVFGLDTLVPIKSFLNIVILSITSSQKMALWNSRKVISHDWMAQPGTRKKWRRNWYRMTDDGVDCKIGFRGMMIMTSKGSKKFPDRFLKMQPWSYDLQRLMKRRRGGNRRWRW